jgi:hypothetical protein
MTDIRCCSCWQVLDPDQAKVDDYGKTWCDECFPHETSDTEDRR